MKKLGKLSDTEMNIMEVIWKEEAPITVTRLQEHFKERDWKTSTVSTMLKRLINKGFLTKKLEGNVNYYRPILTRGQYKKVETETFLDRLYNGNATKLIASLVDNDKLSPEDLAELKVWFNSRDENQ